MHRSVKSFLKSVLILVLIFSTVGLGFATEFFMHTRDGLGFCGKLNYIQYTVGYPYAEIGLDFPLHTIFSLQISTGFDLKANTSTTKTLPLFTFGSFQLGIPLELLLKTEKVETLQEIGRANVGLLLGYTQELVGGVPVSVRFIALFSPYYLYYDPAYNVNIPTVRTEDVFRSRFEIKVSAAIQDITLGFGYSAAFRWLTYRSMFITGQDSIFLELRFRINLTNPGN
ncbi:hypothetical protein [Fervidobacterium thailandense]|uniref:Uncharacterized protein n=1 Tax=Fervidobacterium thailandense TaxID=1008305 RepID=A0A1E3G243_9BACT|nr:hypothetical protein [Fervidobacterium thailandense]ODN29933.1 hypothetical protein A4H02_07970 [Fervidobacterium thailandense]